MANRERVKKVTIKDHGFVADLFMKMKKTIKVMG